MKLMSLLMLLIAGGAMSKGAQVSDYAEADIVVTSSNESELATADASSGGGFADAMGQPGLLNNSILTTAPAGAAASIENESVSGFGDVLTISDPALTGSSGTFDFNFMVDGTENFAASTPALSSITTTADFTASGVPGVTDDLTFTEDSNGVITGDGDFLGTQETVNVPFIFGTPVTISLEIDITAVGDNTSGGGSAATSGTFSTTVTTDDVMAAVTQGEPLTESAYTADSASGMDYFIAEAIPEPDGLYLAMAGLAAVPLLRMRRR